MTQTKEFDFPAAICTLATAEWECPACGGSGHQPMLLCQTCNGTGRIVPFASLRVGKQGIWSHGDCNLTVPCHLLFADGSVPRGTVDCGGRGWIPEPKVRVACWEINETHPEILWGLIEQGENGPYVDYKLKEALIRAALAWLEEQYAGEVWEAYWPEEGGN